MCTTPSVPKAQQYQAAVSPVFNDASEADQAANRGRRGTILANAMPTTAPTAGGKTLLGQ